MGRIILVLGLVAVSCSPPPGKDATQPVEQEATEETSVQPPGDTLFGHFAFPETAGPLADVGNYRETGRVVQLRHDAAEAFRAMQEAARQDGVHLVPVSGLRTMAYQEGLFSRAIDRYGTPQEAALWVAPPGYSEHHTGLALDIGDLDRPETDVETSFEQTASFGWLRNNADRFQFELSFPDGNLQGVSYEPWHWRFVGGAVDP